MANLYKSILIVGLMLALGGCDGSKVAMTKNVTEVTHLSQVEYATTDIANAEELALKIVLANDSERVVLLKQSFGTNKLAVRIAWSFFWNALTKEYETHKSDQNFSDFGSEALASILDLSKLECSADAMAGFSIFAAQFNLGADYIVGSKRSCKALLGANLTRAIVQKWLETKNLLLAKAAVDLLMIESKNSPNQLTWQVAINQTSLSRWSGLLKSLLNNNEWDYAYKIIKLHQDYNGQYSNHRALAEPLVLALARGSAQEFADAEKNLSLSSLLNLMQNVGPAFLVTLKTEAALNLLNLFSKAYLKYNPDLELEQRLSMAWFGYQDLRQLARNFKQLEFNRVLPDWLEQVGQKLDTIIYEAISDDHSALVQQWLTDLATDNLDAGWLRVRLAQHAIFNGSQKLWFEQATLSLSNATPTALDQLVFNRIKVALKLNSIASHCELLAKFGISEKKISIDELQDQFKQNIFSAGCYRLAHESQSSLTLTSKQPVQVGSDYILIAPAVNITIQAPSLAMALIDLSAPQILTKAKTIETDPLKNALVFPVMLGFKTTTADASFNYVNWIVLHLVYREAQNGDQPLKLPQDGQPGGSLTLKLSNRSASILPVLHSLGERGEMHADAQPGGNSDFSSFSYASLRNWMNVHKAITMNSEEDAKTSHVLHDRITIKKLHDLMVESGALTKKINPIFSYQYIHYLPSEQLAKISKVCQGYPTQQKPDLEKCFAETIIPKAMMVLQREVLTQPHLTENYEYSQYISKISDLDQSVSYSSSPGKPGLTTSDGNNGESGKIIIKESNND